MSIALFGDDPAVNWRAVSPRLATVRRITLLLAALPVLLILIVLAILLTDWLWLPAAVVAAIAGWLWWLIGRQVSAITFAELEEEIVVRRGRLFRSLVSVPYGRLQYADMSSGPMERRLGLASVTLHTANPASLGSIPGLPLPDAESLRERLTARGEAQRAGL